MYVILRSFATAVPVQQRVLGFPIAPSRNVPNKFLKTQMAMHIMWGWEVIARVTGHRTILAIASNHQGE